VCKKDPLEAKLRKEEVFPSRPIYKNVEEAQGMGWLWMT
jgi:hypothetical protein